jgi:YHS domain-containing protein
MAHRAAVNYEIYYFADLKDKARFEKDILRHCGVVTDPILRTRFRPSFLSPHEDYMGRRYYFLTDGARAEFAAQPDSFAVRQGM